MPFAEFIGLWLRRMAYLLMHLDLGDYEMTSFLMLAQCARKMSSLIIQAIVGVSNNSSAEKSCSCVSS